MILDAFILLESSQRRPRMNLGRIKIGNLEDT